MVHHSGAHGAMTTTTVPTVIRSSRSTVPNGNGTHHAHSAHHAHHGYTQIIKNGNGEEINGSNGAEWIIMNSNEHANAAESNAQSVWILQKSGVCSNIMFFLRDKNGE